jgi:hypothetical protein
MDRFGFTEFGFDGRAGLNAATAYWNDEIKERLYGAGARGQLDGEYLDPYRPNAAVQCLRKAPISL